MLLGKLFGKSGKTYYVDQPKEGKRGKWWTGIYLGDPEDGGKRIFQTSPPGHDSEEDAVSVAQDFIDGKVEWDKD